MTKTNDAIHLSKPEMLRLMRSFSNQNLETVKYDVWKKIKAIATQSDNDSFAIEENGKFDMSNPMMMYFLMKDTNHKDLLPLLMMAKA